MSSSSHRPVSPGGRRTIQPDRAAAGSSFRSPNLDHEPPAHSAREYASLTRTVMDRSDASRVMPARQRSPPRMPRDDDYALRSRRVSLGPGEPAARRPLSLIAPRSPNRSARPIVTKESDRPSSPLSKSSTIKSNGVQLEASYIIPASSSSGRHHHRHSSLTSSDRFHNFKPDPRDRIYVGGSRASAPRQIVSRPRPDDFGDRKYDYEYTGPRKEFLREPALLALPRTRERRDSVGGGRERPTSVLVPDRQEPEHRRMTREIEFQPAVRGSDLHAATDRSRKYQRSRDDVSDRRHQPGRSYIREARDDTHHRPLAFRNKGREDGFIPYPEENPRHNRPRKPNLEDEVTEARSNPRHTPPDGGRSELKPRESNKRYEKVDGSRSPREQDMDSYRESTEYDERDRKGWNVIRGQRALPDNGVKNASLVGSGVATAAAAGLAVEGVRRHRHRGDEILYKKNSRGNLPEAEREREGSEGTSISGETRFSKDSEDEDREEHRRRHRQGRERDEFIHREAGDHDKQIREGPRPAQAIQGAPTHDLQLQHTDASLRARTSYERCPDTEAMLSSQVHRHRPQLSHVRHADSYSDSSVSTNATDPGRDSISPIPRVVTPSAEDSRPALPAAPPKGILKKARDKFPEPLNPVREGVAPLDAAKKGIPPEARWTRINRRLVNPEALEQEGVRFEEFPDHVIVLKVLNQEEITRYAQKTHEIRENRRAMHGTLEGSGSSGETSHD